jgi:hypothetical protein
MVKDQLLVAFGIEFRGVFKWFHGQSSDIAALKSSLSNRVVFSHVLDFYEPRTVIGSGVSSQVTRFL